MKRGDKIVTIAGEKQFFSAGDVAVIVDASASNGVWADFNSQGNEKVLDDGVWFVDNHNFRAIKETTQEAS